MRVGSNYFSHACSRAEINCKLPRFARNKAVNLNFSRAAHGGVKIYSLPPRHVGGVVTTPKFTVYRIAASAGSFPTLDGITVSHALRYQCFFFTFENTPKIPKIYPKYPKIPQNTQNLPKKYPRELRNTQKISKIFG